MRRLILAILASAAAFGLPSAQAVAGTFSISPLRVDLSTQAQMGVLTIKNQEAQPVVVQADAKLWQQASGHDQLSPTRDVLVTPAVFTIPANGSQVLRVALRRDAEATTELSYRLILTEVPPQPAPGFTGLNVALQVSLPVFVAAKAPTKPQLEWSAAMTADGGIGITARNAGNEHARVLDFSVAGVPGGNAAIEQQVVAYVLPGQSRTWNLASNKNNNETSSAEWRLLRVKGTTEEGDFEAETSLGRE